MKAQQKLNNIEILTIDTDATTEEIRIKYRSNAAFSRMLQDKGEDISLSSLNAVLNRQRRYLSDPSSLYQRLLRTFKAYGVLVEKSNMKEAA